MGKLPRALGKMFCVFRVYLLQEKLKTFRMPDFLQASKKCCLICKYVQQEFFFPCEASLIQGKDAGRGWNVPSWGTLDRILPAGGNSGILSVIGPYFWSLQEVYMVYPLLLKRKLCLLVSRALIR